MERRVELEAALEDDGRGGLGVQASAMTSTGPKASSFLRGWETGGVERNRGARLEEVVDVEGMFCWFS